MKQKARTKEEWREIVEKCRMRQGTISQWCEEHNINTATYKYWATQLNKEIKPQEESPSVLFAELPLNSAEKPIYQNAVLPQGESLIIRCGIFEISVNPDTDFHYLTTILKVVKSLC